MTMPLLECTIKSLPKVASGKVRDIYAVGEDKLLIVTTDRISAYDAVFPTPIKDKGKILVGISNYWFKRLAEIIPNHLTDIAPESVVAADEVDQVMGRAVVVQRLRPVPIEAIARGYLVGSGWQSYKASGIVCGQLLPPGLKQADKLPAPIFTPTTKAEVGEHDEHMTFSMMERKMGPEMAQKIRQITLELYVAANEIANQAGLIIADTKFEFGLDKEGNLVLMDEILTPDSSRIWFKRNYAPGTNPESIDKQVLRDYLDEIGWDRSPPVPELPEQVVEKLHSRYLEAYKAILGESL